MNTLIHTKKLKKLIEEEINKIKESQEEEKQAMIEKKLALIEIKNTYNRD